MAAISLLVAMSLVAPRYYSLAGVEHLEAVSSAVAFAAADQEALARVRRKHPALRVEALFGAASAIRDLPGDLDASRLGFELLQSGAAARLLAVYRHPASGAVLFADEKIRARFGASADPSDVRRWVKAAGGKSARLLYPQLGIYEVLAPSAAQTVDVAARLHESGVALWAHPDFIQQMRRLWVPDDPLLQNQWHHTYLASAAAWDVSRGDPTVIIAIIDSGVDMEHPDLAGKLVAPRDFVQNDDDPSPDSTDAHGTGCSGLAAATADNGVGVAGVCPGCSIMPLRIMSESGFSRWGADSDAFYWAASHGAQVLSNSWGPMEPMAVPRNLDQAIREVADNSRDGRGALIMFASGNEYRENDAKELASHPLVLAVGATGANDRRESYSNWGFELDLVAPAGSVTTDLRGRDGYGRGDYFYGFGGTSAACPVAAAVAGLIFSVDPSLTRGQVQSILTATADKVGYDGYADGFSPRYGHGRVNALRAVQMARGGEVCQPVPEDCLNGVDDDCDALIDAADPGCMSEETVVGAPCAQDFQCGSDGTCMPDSSGYPGGYCTRGCAAGCPGDGVCAPRLYGSACLDGCEAIADCRDGYDCLGVTESGAMACIPSCTVSGCEAGELCNGGTGQCEHHGPVPIGGPCTDNLECAANGICATEVRTQDGETSFPGGLCTLRCSGDEQCPGATFCQNLGRVRFCLKGCLSNSACRDAYACWPNDDDDSSGSCWPACQSDDDCDGEFCNDHGLCGTTLPPVVDKPCVCDKEPGCDDGCPCDSACAGPGELKGATSSSWHCTAGGPSFAAAMMALAWLFGSLRRRRLCAPNQRVHLRL